MVNPRLHNQRAHGVHDNNRILVDRRHRIHQVVATMPGGQVLAVALVAVDRDVVLARVRVDEHDRRVGELRLDRRVERVEVVEDPVHGRAVLPGTQLDRFVGLDSVLVLVFLDAGYARLTDTRYVKFAVPEPQPMARIPALPPLSLN